MRSPEQAVELLEELMDLHNQRFAAISTVFATPARRRFHLLAAQRMAEAGMARIHRLVADGVNAGLQYDFALGDRVFFHLPRGDERQLTSQMRARMTRSG